MSLDNRSNDEEAISALMDDELSDFELRRLLNTLAEKPELADQWSRYSQVRALIDNEAGVTVSPSFANNVMSALDAEPSYSLSGNAKTSVVGQLFSGAGKFAVAASVAVAAFIGMQASLNNSTSVSDTPLAQSDAVQEGPVSFVAASESSPTFDAEAQLRLNEYIRSVSIQNKEDAYSAPQFNVLQDSQLIRQVNQIEN